MRRERQYGMVHLLDPTLRPPNLHVNGTQAPTGDVARESYAVPIVSRRLQCNIITPQTRLRNELLLMYHFPPPPPPPLEYAVRVGSLDLSREGKQCVTLVEALITCVTSCPRYIHSCCACPVCLLWIVHQGEALQTTDVAISYRQGTGNRHGDLSKKNE